jgi:hypothetical protein
MPLFISWISWRGLFFQSFHLYLEAYIRKNTKSKQYRIGVKKDIYSHLYPKRREDKLKSRHRICTLFPHNLPMYMPHFPRFLSS